MTYGQRVTVSTPTPSHSQWLGVTGVVTYVQLTLFGDLEVGVRVADTIIYFTGSELI
jgi:hypothetical protein